MIKFTVKRDLIKKDLKRGFTLLTVITNCFIISGVIHHWKPRARPIYRYTGANDNTKLAAPFEEIAKIQQKATGYPSSEKAD